ncbi:MAG: hypothetical protein KDI07_25860, partial [Anaerolineae bacterium]|nr:hypothetical protein [Anaerolineae bacterium]
MTPRKDWEDSGFKIEDWGLTVNRRFRGACTQTNLQSLVLNLAFTQQKTPSPRNSAHGDEV